MSIIAGVIIGTIVTSLTYEFFMRYTIRSPFQNPIVPRELSPIVAVPLQGVVRDPVSPVVAQEKPINKVQDHATLVKTSKYPLFIDHIWYRESGRGTNTSGLAGYCTEKGMNNEFGFYPTGKHCFPTFEDGVRRLEKWYEDNMGLTDNEKLCYYNTGIVQEYCPYLTENFQAMH